MSTLKSALDDWLQRAETKAANGGLTADDLAALKAMTQQAAPRQRLLYLHTRTPSVYGNVIGMAEHEPVAGFRDKLRTRDDWPYATVHDAIVDGWQVVQFPYQMAPFHDREIDYMGYEFILQKIEEVI